jgi:benzaldehyde dehydrogenase (NAD)
MGVRQGAGVVLGMAPSIINPCVAGESSAPLRITVLPQASGVASARVARMILKGAELSPATQGLIIDALDAAGFPPGVVNYLTCGFRYCPQVRAIIRPTGVEPVKLTRRTAGWAISDSTLSSPRRHKD